MFAILAILIGASLVASILVVTALILSSRLSQKEDSMLEEYGYEATCQTSTQEDPSTMS